MHSTSDKVTKNPKKSFISICNKGFGMKRHTYSHYGEWTIRTIKPNLKLGIFLSIAKNSIPKLVKLENLIATH